MLRGNYSQVLWNLEQSLLAPFQRAKFHYSLSRDTIQNDLLTLFWKADEFRVLFSELQNFRLSEFESILEHLSKIFTFTAEYFQYQFPVEELYQNVCDIFLQ